MSAPSTAAPRRTGRQLAAYLLRRSVQLEIGGYTAILRWVLRRPRVPPGATGFPYAQPVLALLVAFLGVSVVELVVVDLLVRRWEAVRLPLLVLGLWGVVWMLGLLLGMVTRPHAVGPEGLRVRSGNDLDLALPWEVVRSVTRRRRTAQDKPPDVTVDDSGATTLHLRMQGETNLEVELDRPVQVRRPQGAVTVTRLHLFADDPQAFLAAVDRHRAPRA